MMGYSMLLVVVTVGHAATACRSCHWLTVLHWCRADHAVQVLKEKLREALEANQQLQAELKTAGAGGGSSRAGAAVLGENKENAAR